MSAEVAAAMLLAVAAAVARHAAGNGGARHISSSPARSERRQPWRQPGNIPFICGAELARQSFSSAVHPATIPPAKDAVQFDRERNAQSDLTRTATSNPTPCVTR